MGFLMSANFKGIGRGFVIGKMVQSIGFVEGKSSTLTGAGFIRAVASLFNVSAVSVDAWQQTERGGNQWWTS